MIDPLSVLSFLRTCHVREESDEALLPLCAAAAAELDALLRADADAGDIRLLDAAAAAVYHRLCLRALESGQGVSVFKAGDVTVNLRTQDVLDAAARELERARAQATPLLRDDAFYFGQVTV